MELWDKMFSFEDNIALLVLTVLLLCHVLFLHVYMFYTLLQILIGIPIWY